MKFFIDNLPVRLLVVLLIVFRQFNPFAQDNISL
jgi:hypothetical protein